MQPRVKTFLFLFYIMKACELSFHCCILAALKIVVYTPTDRILLETSECECEGLLPLLLDLRSEAFLIVMKVRLSALWYKGSKSKSTYS